MGAHKDRRGGTCAQDGAGRIRQSARGRTQQGRSQPVGPLREPSSPILRQPPLFPLRLRGLRTANNAGRYVSGLVDGVSVFVQKGIEERSPPPPRCGVV